MSHLVEDNILIDSDKIKLTSYDDSCGNYVVLPKQIDGYDVVGVKCSWYGLGYGAGGLFSEKNVKTLVIQDNLTVISPGAFSNSSLQKVVLPDNVTVIGGNAFSSNLLTTIDIPDSVEMIGEYAFCYNEFKTLTIGSGVTLIGQEAFGKAFGSNANLESVIFKNKTCEEIKNIPKSSVNGTKYFPWLYERSPYYEEGNEADIIGTDGVCSY